MNPSNEFKLLVEWTLSLIDENEFYRYLIEENYFMPILGRTTYNDMLLYDYWDTKEALKSKEFLENYLLENFNELLNRYQIAYILNMMLNSSDEVLLLCLRNLSSMSRNGCRFVPSIFEGLDSMTDAIPGQDQRQYWNDTQYFKALEPLNIYKDAIIKEAIDLKNNLANFGIQV
ncbi:hypothetical protein KKA17_05520 [bacterium]|nr:hypothetical protein [bacterium]MBU1883995.1 hypothetical protein [bacterium]